MVQKNFGKLHQIVRLPLGNPSAERYPLQKNKKNTIITPLMATSSTRRVPLKWESAVQFPGQ